MPEIKKGMCTEKDLLHAKTISWAAQINVIDSIERRKNYPDRFPVNSDSVGVELVGRHLNSRDYEAVTQLQNMSLRWLIGELYTHFHLGDEDVFRHPEVSYKNAGEAADAKWK